jgi:hypothetical protein
LIQHSSATDKAAIDKHPHHHQCESASRTAGGRKRLNDFRVKAFIIIPNHVQFTRKRHLMLFVLIWLLLSVLVEEVGDKDGWTPGKAMKKAYRKLVVKHASRFLSFDWIPILLLRDSVYGKSLFNFCFLRPGRREMDEQETGTSC